MAQPLSSPKKVLFTVLVAILLLGLAEVSLRIWDSVVDESDLPYRKGMSFTSELYLLHRNESHFQIPELHTNSLGFRGAEIQQQPASGTFRVVMMGGSAMFGFGASSDQATIPAQTEQLLSQRFPDRKIEVVNAGQGSYNSTQELIQYQVVISKLKPDLVVVMDGYNDFYHSLGYGIPAGVPAIWATGGMERALGDILSPDVRLADFRRPLSKILSQSALTYRLLRLYVQHQQQTTRPPAEPANVSPETEAVDVYLRNIRHLAAVTAADEVPLVVGLQPIIADRVQRTSQEEEFMTYGGKATLLHAVQALLGETSRRLHEDAAPPVDVVDLTSAVRDAPEPIFIDAVHLTDVGNALLAARFAEVIAAYVLGVR